MQSSVGIRARLAEGSQLQPVHHQVGEPERGHLQVRQVGDDGQDVGSQEEQQNYDIRETQPSHDVCSFVVVSEAIPIKYLGG